jgi:hypothetical protein
MKFDQENLLDAILEVMIGSLNTQIAAIEAEKTAAGSPLTPTLAGVDSSAYFVQTWSDKILNKSPAIFYGIEDVATLDGGGAAAKTYKIFCEIVIVDDGQRNDTHRRIARYSRALEEIFSEQFGKVPSGSAIKIETVRPISFKLELDSSEEVKVGGVSLQISLV